ncbi:MAG: hypothetical protein HY292_26285 [Planctomycetes bacterium]|nr:hypothetical protein [Planctomycetota bacterium]
MKSFFVPMHLSEGGPAGARGRAHVLVGPQVSVEGLRGVGFLQRLFESTKLSKRSAAREGHGGDEAPFTALSENRLTEGVLLERLFVWFESDEGRSAIVLHPNAVQLQVTILASVCEEGWLLNAQQHGVRHAEARRVARAEVADEPLHE